MKDKKKTQDAFLEAISILIDKKLKKLKFNYYVDGVIQEKNSNNTYNVLINGKTYNNIPSKNQLKYSVNDTVQILIKNGDWNKKFIDSLSHHTKSILDDMYPVGSVYITSTNTNPANTLGGTWELVNKGFRNESGNGTTEYFTGKTVNDGTTDSTVEGTVCYNRSDSTIMLRIGITAKTTFNDSGVVLGTLNFKALGFTALSFAYWYIPALTDYANGGLAVDISYDTGVIRSDFCIGGSTITSLSSGKYYPYYINITFNVEPQYMIDSFCDKFYWKRTA